MSEAQIYYQCVLKRIPFMDGSHVAKEGDITIGWIASPEAYTGHTVELIGEEGMWTIDKVYFPGISYQEIQDQRNNTKRSFLSISRNRAV